MPSSTSSSSTRIPEGSYVRMWVGVILLLAMALGFSEFWWRRADYRPNVSDTKIFWSYHRDRVYPGGDMKPLVIVGASRAQLGIDPAVLEENFPGHRVIHLAIDGTTPLGVLRDLAEDEDFDGIVLCSASVLLLHQGIANENRRDQEYVDHFHDVYRSGAGIEKRINGVIAGYFQSRSVISSSVLSLESLLGTRFDPPRLGQHMRFSRFRPAYYFDRMTTEELQAYRDRRVAKHLAMLETKVSEDEIRNLAENDLARFRSELNSRGGELVLIRMPTTGEHWNIDQKVAPKAVFWDNLEEWSGIPTIHFQDHEELADFDCPDTSHLEANDARVFTGHLAAILHGMLGATP